MTIKDLASKVRGSVLITVENENGEEAIYDKNGTFAGAASAHELDENTLIQFKSDYWDMIKDDVIELDVAGLRMVGRDYSGNHPGLIVYVNVDSDDGEPITEELLVETEAELVDAMDDDSFDRIRLAGNIALASKLAVYDATKTLDLAEFTLSIDDSDSPVIQVGEDADLNITGDGVVRGNAGAITVVDGGKVTLEDGAYICGTASDDSDTCVIYVQHGTALINGGAFSNSDTNGKLLDDLNGSDAVIEVRGGKFVGQDPIDYVMDGYTTSVEDVDGVNVYTVLEQ